MDFEKREYKELPKNKVRKEIEEDWDEQEDEQVKTEDLSKQAKEEAKKNNQSKWKTRLLATTLLSLNIYLLYEFYHFDSKNQLQSFNQYILNSTSDSIKAFQLSTKQFFKDYLNPYLQQFRQAYFANNENSNACAQTDATQFRSQISKKIESVVKERS